MRAKTQNICDKDFDCVGSICYANVSFTDRLEDKTLTERQRFARFRIASVSQRDGSSSKETCARIADHTSGSKNPANILERREATCSALASEVRS